MKIKYDKDALAAYVRLTNKSITNTSEIGPSVIVDFDDNEDVVGIEILNAGPPELEE